MDGEFEHFKDVRSLWSRLWREIYGEPPPLADDPQLLSRILMESLPPLPPYELGKSPAASAARPRERGDPLTPARADPSD